MKIEYNYFQILAVIALVTVSCCLGGPSIAVPAVIPAAYSIPVASSYSAHVINHAIAAPVAAPLLAAPVTRAVFPSAPAVAPLASYSPFGAPILW